MWTGTFPNLGDYGPPPSLCFDYFCQETRDDPVQADHDLEDYNLDMKVQGIHRLRQGTGGSDKRGFRDDEYHVVPWLRLPVSTRQLPIHIHTRGSLLRMLMPPLLCRDVM